MGLDAADEHLAPPGLLERCGESGVGAAGKAHLLERGLGQQLPQIGQGGAEPPRILLGGEHGKAELLRAEEERAAVLLDGLEIPHGRGEALLDVDEEHAGRGAVEAMAGGRHVPLA